LLVRWFGHSVSHVANPGLKHKAKHAAKWVATSVVRHWAPGLIAIGLALVAWAGIEISLTQVTPAPPVSLPSPSRFTPPVETPAPTVSPTGQPTQPTPTPEPTVPVLPPNVGLAVYSERPAVGHHLGTITLPTLGLSWPIFEGTTITQLNRGVGHFRTSVLPGENDNSVLSGHRATVFNRLGELRLGQSIVVRTEAGTFLYKVTGTRIVLRTDRTVIVPTPHAVLTLTTCYPFNAVGTTTHAYIVSADLVRY
jgi:sortase A